MTRWITRRLGAVGLMMLLGACGDDGSGAATGATDGGATSNGATSATSGETSIDPPTTSSLSGVTDGASTTDITTGKVMLESRARLAPPRTVSRKREDVQYHRRIAGLERGGREGLGRG